MRNFLRYIAELGCALLMVSVPSAAKPVEFRRFQVDEGLINNSVFTIIQDSHGFMWFGTKAGLNRFDGKNFKHFNNSSLGGANIYYLFEDADEVLWIGSDRGLYTYNAVTENFYQVPETAGIHVRDIEQDSKGNIWYLKGAGLSCIDRNGKQVFYYEKPNAHLITSVCRGSDNTIWIATSAGEIENFNPYTRQFIPYNVFNHSPHAKSGWIENISNAGSDRILIGTANQGVKVFDTKNHTYADILTYDPQHNEIFARNFVRVDEHNFWIATEAGIFQYNMATGESEQFIKKFNDPYSLSDNAVYTLWKDREGGVWAGTYFGGVNYHPGNYMSFEKFFPQEGRNSLKGNAVREICPDAYGNLWIGTEDAGLHQMNPITGDISKVLTQDGKEVSHSNVHGLLATDNELWIGTFEHGLDVMDIRTRRVIRKYVYSEEPGQLKTNFISTLYRTGNNDILVGTSRGIYIYNKTTDDFSLIREVPPVHIKDILEDNRGRIWLSTLADGLYNYDPGAKTVNHFTHQPSRSSSLPSNMVNSVFQSEDGQIWITTEAGLSRYKSFDHFETYTTTEGLNSNVTYRVLEDAHHQLWITTANGLATVDPETGKIKNYFKANGLLSNQFNYNSSYKDRTGRMFFGCVKGMIRFNPDCFEINRWLPPVYIIALQVGNQDLDINPGGILQSSLLYSTEINLAYTQSSFSIDFAGLSFTAPELVEYAYKMEGLDEGWTYLKTNRKIYFTELDPGRYVFRVKATNSSGIWNPRETTLVIHIAPPFWATKWAYTLYVLLAAGAIILLVRNYHRRIKEKNRLQLEKLYHEKEKEVYRAKIDFFTNVAHEIKTPLALIKGPMEEIIKAGSHSPLIGLHLKIMDRNTRRLTDLTTQLLDFRQVESSEFRLNLSQADITSIVREHYLYFKPMAELKGLTRFTIKTPGRPLVAYIDTDAFSKILNNLFDNAVKYADTLVHITLTGTTDLFELRVENDGLVVPDEQKERVFEAFVRLKSGGRQAGSGIGLAVARSLAELHKGTLQMDYSVTDQNVFVLQLPVQQVTDRRVVAEHST